MIIIDTREKKKKEDISLRELVADKLKSTRVTLEVGDYVIIGPTRSVCVESKSMPDYLASINDGRLDRELRNMSANYDKNVLIVYGNLNRELLFRKFPRRSFYEKLAGCIVHESPRGNKSAVSVVTLNNVHDAAYLICTLHNLTTNDDIYREPTAKRLKLTPEEQKLGTFYSLPNIGRTRALAFKKEFKTLKNLANSSREDMLKVNGIGKTIAERVWEHFNEGEI